MLTQNGLWLATHENKDRYHLLLPMANRHGIISGATGTGKTTTLKVMIEGFSKAGVPTFVADVKGDLASLSVPGVDSEDMQSRIQRFGIEDWSFENFPVQLWDIYEKNGMPIRAKISSMGPTMLSRLLDLSDAQEGVLNIVFNIADKLGLEIIDLKDLSSTLQYVYEHKDRYKTEYGNIAGASVNTIQRIILQLRNQGGDLFFGEPEIDIMDWIKTDEAGKGYVNILHSETLINTAGMYSMFLLWMLGELFNRLPEVGDLEKPKIVFFFDEAHLLFKGTSPALISKIEQVVKLIRSKGVGVYFCTQSPSDIPDSVLAQLSNRVQHALRAYTPNDQKVIKAAANGFRQNPDLDLVAAISELKTGEAVVSFLQEDGSPSVVQRAYIMPPQSKFGTIDELKRDQLIHGSTLYSKYAESYDAPSAYESLVQILEPEKDDEVPTGGTALEQELAAIEKEKAEKEKKSGRKQTSMLEKAVKHSIQSNMNRVARKLLRGILDNLVK